ncbi:lipopolysaccharide heptosyltransferase I [Ramlibacter sp.]|uniref:lipopolysaccharide heptosyltransferase I n=1 Tax=Ramlibacter sp. TaxID=1917967 RepID=UPI002B8751A3|nr:lipopolysaccharide heptosyltransferase I [Ramlibacter sp.]HWI82344.1 lipopolysaccharide heptosyltransferase I [Ramlibacter sp.]
MNILIVKLSSLGDVVHAMPAVQDLRAAIPGAVVDWVVEGGFAPLVRRCDGVRRVIGFGLRRWRRAPLGAQTAAEWRVFREQLRGQRYDAVIDLQGLTKSALVARAARLAPGGRRYAMANRTEGSSYEAPTRWLADVAIRLEPHVHAVTRSRELCARALGYRLPAALRFGLHADPQAVAEPGEVPSVALIHGTSRADKCWPEPHWLELGRRLVADGFRLALPHGDEAELQRARRIAQALGPAVDVWPRLDLGHLTDRLAGCAGVIGVDSGLSHVAVALDLPHVQIYNFDTAWRTGPLPPAAGPARQRSVHAAPSPSVDAVWLAWQGVSGR